MQIDYAFILAAGKGTRMGDIGKFLPKPMWPIFNKTLLELQLKYCHDLGVKKVFINTHYLADSIRSFISLNKFSVEVIELFEPILLDSGGAIHNLAQHKDVNYKGNVILINADQFLLFNKEQIHNSLLSLENNRACLFGIKVEAKSSYNELKIENSLLTAIEKNDGTKEYVTYSGLGLLKLDGLKKVSGISRFFETVADFKHESITISVPTNYEYWDFGTAKIYHENILKITELVSLKQKNMLIEFLMKHNALDENYRKFCSAENKSIDLEGRERFQSGSITWQENVQKV
jgi:choline kinase